LAHSGPIIEPDGKVYFCHVYSKISRKESVDESIGQVGVGMHFSQIWDDFNSNCINGYFSCKKVKYCNSRDLALNRYLSGYEI
jgi:hypothetical protein